MNGSGMQFWLSNCSQIMTKKKILQTLISSLQLNDTLAWLPHQDGRFSVKRGYWFAHRLFMLSADHPEFSSMHNKSAQQKYWKLLWKVNLFPRIKLWAWQTFHDRRPNPCIIVFMIVHLRRMSRIILTFWFHIIMTFSRCKIDGYML